MASNYEQPKLATSKQYNVSQGNIGQVKQYTTDWTDYESAKIWEEVAKGTDKVNESIQESAKLRGMLDQTGNLVAQNSPLTEDSYNQGRAEILTTKKKGAFLELVDRTAREVALKNGTMEDYNKAIEPALQEAIKGVRNVATVDVNGNPISIELQNETLVNGQKEMLTYVTLGQQKFQKIKEEQNEVDRQELNANVGSNLLSAVMVTPKAADLVPIIMNTYEQLNLIGARLGSLIKAKAEADGITSDTLAKSIALLDPTDPLSTEKVNAIRSTINSPELTMHPIAKIKVLEAIDKFEREVNGAVDYEISGAIDQLEIAAATGNYKPGMQAAIAKSIEAGVRARTLTFPQAKALNSRLSNVNEAIAKSSMESGESITGMDATSANGVENHPEKVYKFFMEDGGKRGLSISEAQTLYAQYATSGWRKEDPKYGQFLLKQYGKEFSSYFPLDSSVQIDEFLKLQTPEGQDKLLKQWPVMMAMSAQVKAGAPQAIAATFPKEYQQPFIQLAYNGKLTGSYLDDMKAMQAVRKNIELNANSEKTVAVLKASNFKPSFWPFGADSEFQKEFDFWNSYGDVTGGYVAQLANNTALRPGNMDILRSSGYDISNEVSKMAGLHANGLLYSTGKYAVVSDLPEFEKRMINGKDNILGTDVKEYLNTFADTLIKANGGKGLFKDRNIVFHFDGNTIKAEAFDEATARKINLPKGIDKISLQKLQTDFAELNVGKQAKANVPLTVHTPTGSKITYNQVTLQKEFDNAEVNRKVVNRVVAGEGYVPKITATNPDKPGVLTIGGGVSINDHPVQAKAIQEGIAKGDQAMIDKAHTEVLARQMKYSLPAVRSIIGSTDPQNLDVRQREAVAVIFDAGYWGGAKWANTVAEAIKVTKATGDWRKGMAVKANKDTRSLNEVGEIHVGYKANGTLNARGEDLVRMLKMFSDKRWYQ